MRRRSSSSPRRRWWLPDLLGMPLRYEGWDVRLAADGQKALKLIREFRPDVVVLDVMLPAIDGLPLPSRLRANGDETPVLFLTAKEVVAARSAGDAAAVRGVGRAPRGGRAEGAQAHPRIPARRGRARRDAARHRRPPPALAAARERG